MSRTYEKAFEVTLRVKVQLYGATRAGVATTTAIATLVRSGFAVVEHLGTERIPYPPKKGTDDDVDETNPAS